jgi:hypothetical protein
MARANRERACINQAPENEISLSSKYIKKTWNFLSSAPVGIYKQLGFIAVQLTINTRQFQNTSDKEIDMGTILIIILILLLVGGLPVFPHSRSWGYGPSGIIGVVLVVLLILLLLGKI